jgi:hypothetical protein
MTDELVTIRDAADRALVSTPAIVTTITIYGSAPRHVVLELRGREAPCSTRDPAIVSRLLEALARVMGAEAEGYDVLVDWGAT